MNKAREPQFNENSEDHSPRGPFKSSSCEANVSYKEAISPEKMEKELESSLVRDIEFLVKRLIKQDFS